MDAQGLTSPQRKLVMWYKVKELKSKGLKHSQIGRELDLHRDTVRKYSKMTLDEFEASEAYKRDFIHKLDPYEEFVRDNLFKHPYLSAKLPPKYDLNDYDFNFSTGISEQQLKELRQLAWLDQAYNLVLMGPSGTGKTYIASGLIYETIKARKKAYMISMEDILTCLRTKDISSSALVTYNKWLKADLLAIDDIMLFPVKKEESAAFFNMINSLHEKTSVIITTNKAPTEWVQTLNDEVLATAILDRLLYRCEVIKLAGTSYRLENRKTIFKENAS